VSAQQDVNAFDADGHAVTLEGIGVTYDALGRAVEAAEPGGAIEFLYGPEGGKLAVMNGQTLATAYIPLPGGGTAVYHGGTLAYYRHSDALGSSRLASTPGRALYSATAYAPYGEHHEESGTIDRDFTGQDQDIDSSHSGGQYDFLDRELSPIQGRWWAPDPAGLAAVDPSNPQSWNRYAYVGGAPLEVIDPSGLCGNVVIGGSTQTPGTPGIAAQTAFANSIDADIAFPFAHMSILGSLAEVEEAGFVANPSVLVAASAIAHAAANGGPFTIYAISGGAQVTMTALAILGPKIASRATVVGISPGFALNSVFGAGNEFEVIYGGQGLDDAVGLTADFAGLNPGPAYETVCGHNPQCEFQAASSVLRRYASPSCGTMPATFTGGGGYDHGGGGGRRRPFGRRGCPGLGRTTLGLPRPVGIRAGRGRHPYHHFRQAMTDRQDHLAPIKRYAKHLAVAWPGLFAASVVVAGVAPRGLQRVVDMPGPAPYFPFSVFLGLAAGWAMNLKCCDREASWVFVPPLVWMLIVVYGDLAAGPKPGWSQVWTNELSNACLGTECLGEALATAPLYAALAYALAATLARLRRPR